MRLKDLLRILVLNSIFTNVVNLIFFYVWTDNLLKDSKIVLISGFAMFSIQSVLVLWLTKRYRGELFRNKMFAVGRLLQGLLGALSIWLLTQAWTWYSTGAYVEYPAPASTQLFLVIFFLNTFPAAFLEEILFRHLPLRYGENKKLSIQQITILAAGIAFIFSISHISAYLVRDHIPFDQLALPLLSAFFYGLAYFLIYAVTRNIYLVTFIHAFSNNPLYLIDSPYRETFYFYTYIFVMILWLVLREIRKRIFW
jgi:membrane protease YdiL (CAAX protease family)